MKSSIIYALLLLPFSVLAAIEYEQYLPVVWQDLKIDNPAVKDVFVNVQKNLEQKDIVIPAFIVKSWMKNNNQQPIYFLSAQPYVCEHSKPPYANQMVKVNTSLNIDLLADNAVPIYAFGNIMVDANKAGIFSSAYTIELHDIQPYKGIPQE